MSLYNKYRPQNFANLVGQDHIRETLLHEIQKGTLAHAYLFAGPRGTGKTSTARLIAKALNCTNKSQEGEPCDKCDFCTSITEGNLIDVIEIDAASNRGIDEIRDLKEKINFAPTRAKTKTYIIDEVHMLSKDAFNALLKTLEEPPENVFFILCTTEIHKILETIISRCQRFDFKRIDIKTIMTRLSYIAQLEGIAAEDSAIELIARHVEGGLRDAIGLLEQMTIDKKLLTEHVRSHLGITGHKTIETLIDLLQKKELGKAIHLVNEVHNEGYDLTSFIREILECLRNKLIESIQQSQPNTDLWLEMITKFEEARDMQRNTLIPQLPLEIAVIKICGEKGIITKEKIQEKPKSETADLPPPSPQAQKEEEKTAAKLKQEYQTEQFQGEISKHWPRVLEHITPPSLRRSLTEGKTFDSEDGSSITLKFSSRFHMEKVNNSENKVKIEKAIEHLFKKKVKVLCELEIAEKKLEEIDLPESASVSEKSKTKPEKGKKSAEDITKKAMEIFGGEEN